MQIVKGASVGIYRPCRHWYLEDLFIERKVSRFKRESHFWRLSLVWWITKRSNVQVELLTVVPSDFDFFSFQVGEPETDRIKWHWMYQGKLSAKTKKKNVKWKKRRCFQRKFTLAFNSFLVTFTGTTSYCRSLWTWSFHTVTAPAEFHCFCWLFFTSQHLLRRKITILHRIQRPKVSLFFVYILKNMEGGRLSKRSGKTIWNYLFERKITFLVLRGKKILQERSRTNRRIKKSYRNQNKL